MDITFTDDELALIDKYNLKGKSLEDFHIWLLEQRMHRQKEEEQFKQLQRQIFGDLFD
jgi:hypothetical protein